MFLLFLLLYSFHFNHLTLILLMHSLSLTSFSLENQSSYYIDLLVICSLSSFCSFFGYYFYVPLYCLHVYECVWVEIWVCYTLHYIFCNSYPNYPIPQMIIGPIREFAGSLVLRVLSSGASGLACSPDLLPSSCLLVLQARRHIRLIYAVVRTRA